MKNAVKYIFVLALVPICVIGGSILFGDKNLYFSSVCVAVLGLIPFFMQFERRQDGLLKILLLTVMTALSVVGRVAFAFLPSFKPVAAIVIITAMYIDPMSGFMCGALSALVSNMFFSQGAWTPFQMMGWGLVGFVAGLLSVYLRKSRAALCIYAIFAGVMYSFIMDLLTVLWIDNALNLKRYAAVLVTAAPTTAVYAVSNVIFLLLFCTPIGRAIERIKVKYGAG